MAADQEPMVPVKYIGTKDVKTDNVADTGVIWLGHGDVQKVPARAWPRLKLHPEVWMDAREAEQPKPDDDAPFEPTIVTKDQIPEGAKYVLETGDEANPGYIVLDTIKLEDLKKMAKANEVKFSAQTKDPLKLAAVIYTTITKKE